MKKGEKLPPKDPGTFERLINRFIQRGAKKKYLPADRLFEFFQSQIIDVSANLGLLGNLVSLSLAGDGTPLATASLQRSKPSCDCYAQGIAKCDHPHLFSQLGCDSGWDSSREKYYNGYSLYMISACDSEYDLPLYPRLQPASKYDPVSFVTGSIELIQRFTLGTTNRFFLNAAHDAEAIYELLKHQGYSHLLI